MRMIDVLENFQDGGQFYVGERRNVEDDLAARACGAGWARDSSGELPTGEADLSPRTLDIQGGKHDAASSTLGVSKNG